MSMFSDGNDWHYTQGFKAGVLAGFVLAAFLLLAFVVVTIVVVKAVFNIPA